MEVNPLFKLTEQHDTTDPDPEPHQRYEVHCSQCSWWGMLGQLKTIYKANPFSPDDAVPEPCCPMCLSDQWLEYKED